MILPTKKKQKQKKHRLQRQMKPFFKNGKYLFVAFSLFYLFLAFGLNSDISRPDVKTSFQQNIQYIAARGDISEKLQKCYPDEEETAARVSETDAEFIAQALNVEEDATDIIYRLSEKMREDVSVVLPECHQELFEKLPRVNEISIPEREEAEYAEYEEELPHNVIDDFWEKDHTREEGYRVNLAHKNIKEIDVSVKHKPVYFGRKPLIAVVIDDMGINRRRTKDISSLQAPLTASFLTYGQKLHKQVDEAFASGHEVMIHVPMEPKKASNLAPDTLTVQMDEAEIKSGLNKMLSLFDNVKGINNHMGSRFTEDKERMGYVMEILNENNLFFLDSKTSSRSVGKAVAREKGVDYVHRHVFLDNENKLDYIIKQLEITEKIAQKNGYAIAIGHPKSQTFEALKQWLPTLPEKNIRLVHLSKIVKLQNQ